MSFISKKKNNNFSKTVYKIFTIISKILNPIIKHIRKRTCPEFWELCIFIIIIITLILTEHIHLSLLFVSALCLWSGLNTKNMYLKRTAYYSFVVSLVLTIMLFILNTYSWNLGMGILMIISFLLSTSIGFNYLLIIILKKYYNENLQLKEENSKTVTNKDYEKLVRQTKELEETLKKYTEEISKNKKSSNSKKKG